MADAETIKMLLDYQDETPLTAFSFHWGTDGFSGPRNACLKNSTGDYIFWIDSDETADPSICKLLDEADGSAYYIHQISKLPGGDSIDVPQIRLFPNIQGVKWELPIHEQVMFSLEKMKIPFIDTEAFVNHNGYDSKEKIKSKHIRNFDYLQNYVMTQRNDRKMKYIKDRYNESLSYLKSNNLLGEGSGWVGLATSLAAIAIPLIQAGISAHQATEEAKKQANIIRELTYQEMNELAILYNKNFPAVSVSDWMINLQIEGLPQIPDGPREPDPDLKPDPNTNLYYIAGAILLIFALRR
jgi:hypothetical protein